MLQYQSDDQREKHMATTIREILLKAASEMSQQRQEGERVLRRKSAAGTEIALKTQRHYEFPGEAPTTVQEDTQ